MRIRVSYATEFAYDSPAKSLIQVLRLTPRPHEGQNILHWRVRTDADARFVKGEDALGNLTHTSFIWGPIDKLCITVEGEAETWDTVGVVRGCAERFDPAVFLRETSLTAAGPLTRDFAESVADGADGRLDALHRLKDAVAERLTPSNDPDGESADSVEAVLQQATAVPRDFAHLFIASARHLGAPCRYVSGHRAEEDETVLRHTHHAWAEAYVERLGWVGFDPANATCPDAAYIRVACGLDCLGAAPMRTNRSGVGAEKLDVKVRVTATQQQSQS